jgi:hypothetical protein
MKKAVIAAIALALTSGVGAAKTSKHRRHAAPPPSQQIACTAVGCLPVPRGCRPTEGRTWSGMPSGNDVIVCPPGIAPFR